jgi:hypothetical protein
MSLIRSPLGESSYLQKLTCILRYGLSPWYQYSFMDFLILHFFPVDFRYSPLAEFANSSQLAGVRPLQHDSRFWVKTVSKMHVTTGPSRRRISRISVTHDLWVYWESHSGRDISKVRDLSPSGLFLETRARKREGEMLNLHFLVQEGQIRAEAVVRHAISGRGLGMKISSVPTQDAPHLIRLISRLRENPLPPQAPPRQKP